MRVFVPILDRTLQRESFVKLEEEFIFALFKLSLAMREDDIASFHGVLSVVRLAIEMRRCFEERFFRGPEGLSIRVNRLLLYILRLAKGIVQSTGAIVFCFATCLLHLELLKAKMMIEFQVDGTL